MHWDNSELAKELVVRPLDSYGRALWHWSGSCHLVDRCAAPAA